MCDTEIENTFAYPIGRNLQCEIGTSLGLGDIKDLGAEAAQPRVPGFGIPARTPRFELRCTPPWCSLREKN